MNDNIRKFSYEDTDKKIEIEIYGLVFEINKNSLENQIDKILGDGSVEKINKKRVADGYKEMDLQIELNLLGCIFETYANATMNNVTNRITNTARNINNRINELNNMNRQQRRYNKYNRYRRY